MGNYNDIESSILGALRSANACFGREDVSARKAWQKQALALLDALKFHESMDCVSSLLCA